MTSSIANWIIAKVSRWLLHNAPPKRAYLCDFNHICHEVRPGDILLIEGRSRVSQIIRLVTQSPWTHAVLYIGQMHDLEDANLRNIVQQHYHCPPSSQLLVESVLGLGTVISPITKYKDDHIRILRPQGLGHLDIQKVIAYAVSRLGTHYSIRHLLDLARFLFPWSLFPRRWRSSLFQHNAAQPTQDICSSMLADAFHSVRFPILPLIQEDDEKNLELIQRNARLFTPSDFDYSPYFAVIKYPIFPLGKYASQQDLPWKEGVISNDEGSNIVSSKQRSKS